MKHLSYLIAFMLDNEFEKNGLNALVIRIRVEVTEIFVTLGNLMLVMLYMYVHGLSIISF